MATVWHEFGHIYARDIVDAGKQPHLVILLSFLLTFLSVRLLTHAIRAQRVPFLRNLSAGGVHIHHLVWGILLLLITGYAGIAFSPDRGREILAVLFGIGAALTLDEFALWLRLQDVYWTPQGRRSIDAVIITSVILGLFVLGSSFWINVVRLLGDAARLS